MTDYDKADDVAIYFMRYAMMQASRDYIARGRSLAGYGDSAVQDVWVAAFERWIEQKNVVNARNMDDAAAELRLREMDPPYDRVKAKTDKLQEKIRQLGADARSKSLDQEIDNFLQDRASLKN
jgi:hypothetical protein